MHLELITNKLNSVLEATPEGLIEKLVATLDGANSIFVTGAGRSGLVSRFFCMRLVHTGYRVFQGGEIVTPAIQAGDLLLVVSASGGTSTLMPLVQKAKSLGAKVAVVTQKTQSPMAEVADLVVAIGSKDPNIFNLTKGMPMGSIFELSALLFLEATISYIIQKKGLTEEGMRAIHANLE
jgi:6-phospho-3-hexuloisomerase